MTTVIGTIVSHSHASIGLVILGSIIVGVIWGILLGLSYIFFRFLSTTFKNKLKSYEKLTHCFCIDSHSFYII